MDNKTKAFLEKAKSLYGDKYTYEKVNYINSITDIIITCPKHGDFIRKPVKFINNKRECPICKKESSKDTTKLTEDFIKKARAIHGNKYDYSKVKYYNNREKVIIICKKHGEFEQTPSSHLNNRGCYECGRLRKTTSVDTFIEKAKHLHNNKYDYSKVVYVNNYTPVTIICPMHGEFTQEPHGHLKGYGCKKCGIIIRTKPVNEFIKEANKKHNNKYDYTKVNYINAHTKVDIICPLHGMFRQEPSNHLNGNGCPDCSIENKTSNTDDFIFKARIRFDDMYEYSKVKYVNNQTPVIITCPIHGDFEQTPNNHLTSAIGCNKCASESIKLTKKEFIEKATIRHDNRYDYSKVVYNSNKDRITIICKEHGEFEQIAANHLFGKGCMLCQESKGEKILSKVLDGLGIKYKREYKIKGYNYRYDFYIPDLDLFIELHGGHHYYPIKKWGGIEKYNRTIKNDKIKERLVKELGSKMIIIKQPKKITDIRIILLKELKILYPYMYLDSRKYFHEI